ncbi:MAG: ParB/RepB/Spo0J family partition protein [Christensenella sp.]|uniref:ParB/RepB/Spo0J family partition protein n=1 Tax=Christensenella sp. TaxID=1935934 RepID=UPI002B204FA2|nr:ParB/RepB/Spo0J family partition protein [Christensenella sp.]MEA5002721.1 ParB/RepB/Spo0J family partition protein [Christensenella sp.]
MGTNLKPQLILKIEQLEPHPGNPRKDLGDLTELTESIRENGVLQNLTVVPLDQEWEKYRIIIGHRRFAAAKAAGLTELYCTVAEGMDEKEQMATMLAENIQRNDLTVTEEAQAIVQMEMDYGLSVEKISAMTGISETKVRQRRKIAKIEDAKAVDQARQSGVTLMDLARIGGLRKSTQEYVMQHAGSINFDYFLRQMEEKDNADKQPEEAVKKHESELIKIDKQGDEYTYEDILRGGEDIEEKLTVAIERIDGEAYYTIDDGGKNWPNGIKLYSKRDKQAEEKEEAKAAEKKKHEDMERKECIGKLQAAWNLGKAGREAHIKKMSERDARVCWHAALKSIVGDAAEEDNWFNGQTGWIWGVIDGVEKKDRNKWIINNPEKALIIMAYMKVETGCYMPCNENGKVEDFRLKDTARLMDFMEDMDYEPSAMEAALADGTSDLYLKPVEEGTENA